MGRAKKQKRRELGAERLSRLLELGTKRGIEIEIFSAIHCRIHGHRTVDYWPTSGRCWVTNSNERAQEMTPDEAIDLAGFTWDGLPEGAADHLRSLQ